MAKSFGTKVHYRDIMNGTLGWYEKKEAEMITSMVTIPVGTPSHLVGTKPGAYLKNMTPLAALKKGNKRTVLYAN